MKRREYISNRFKRILSETFNHKADEIMEKIKLNLDKEVPFSKPGKSFDYVEEREMCNECGGYKGGEMIEGQMCECGPMYEELKGGQKKLDVAKPYGKLTKDDFTKLRRGVKKHMEENDFDLIASFHNRKDKKWQDEEPLANKGPKHGAEMFSDYMSDEMPNDSEDTPQRRERKHPLKRKKDREDEIYEKECMECGPSYEMKEKLYGKQNKLDRNKNGKIDSEDFKMLRNKVKKHIKEYSFGDDKIEDVEPYGDTSSNSPKKPGRVKNVGYKYQKKVSKKFDDYEMEESKRKDQMDETQYRLLSNGEFALFTENEIIDMIEKIVNEEKNNIKMSTQPKGMTEYERVHKADKKEEDQYFKDLAKKMKDYLKDASDKESKYEMKETQKFPTENGGKKKKYTPSDAVDEYIEAFSYPGQTNLRFDEVKPVDGNIEKYLKGHSTTGNAQVDEDGNALGNVVPSEVGEKFYKNYKENLYGQEQANASYKRQPQPVDVAGEETEGGSLKSKRGKKAQSILDKLDESISVKPEKLNEEFERMQVLMGYKKKTQ